MKRLNKFLIFIILFALIFTLSGCNKLEITESMQQAIDIYVEAVSKSELKDSGRVMVSARIDDNAIEFKKTGSIIDFEYEIIDGKVIFDRVDYIDSEEITDLEQSKTTKYKSDGETVLKLEKGSDEWVDCTDENKNFLDAKLNPFVTLSLFRVDAKHKVNTDYLTDVKLYELASQNVVEFTLKDSTVSDVLGYYKAKGIVRESAGHKRTYYIDQNGYISKIEISTTQKIISNGEEGTYTNDITVICE